MKLLSGLIFSSLLMSFGFAQDAPNVKLGAYRPVLELARTVQLIAEIDGEGLPLSAAQARNVLVILRGLDARDAIAPDDAANIVAKLEVSLSRPQREALTEKRKALEEAARKRMVQARPTGTNALTMISWTVPGGPLMVVTLERNQKLNPFKVRGSQEAYQKLVTTLEKRTK